ncbi:hypothetical protein [Amycolatopsis alkalitolerans]|uniref:Uncharacterized protein n=1 Tax=Amycolatopsis alkalitolerans TaxID=2547244 RepID=A0A5C4M0D4_9PSEU|nr:hypothetical protein [Amycolatopsis alkalitolerans]TNC25103.1 hypothetical protein FG385_15770 [Amycolatopsis alkalitolerans]
MTLLQLRTFVSVRAVTHNLLATLELDPHTLTMRPGISEREHVPRKSDDHPEVVSRTILFSDQPLLLRMGLLCKQTSKHKPPKTV